MQIELDRLADFMGKLCGTARYDWVSADSGDVGLHGVPIKQWRDAYFEGCKDMAEGIASLVPVECRETMKQIAQASFTKAFDEAKIASEKERAELAR